MKVVATVGVVFVSSFVASVATNAFWVWRWHRRGS